MSNTRGHVAFQIDWGGEVVRRHTCNHGIFPRAYVHLLSVLVPFSNVPRVS